MSLIANPQNSSAHEKLTRELTEKAETLDRALETCRSKNEYLEKKVRVLEQDPKGSKTWFNGEKAHTMYVKQAQGNSVPKNQQEKKRPFRPGKGKYGYVQYNSWCRFYGNNGHTVHDCKKKHALNARSYTSCYNTETEVHDLNDASYYEPAPPIKTFKRASRFRYQRNSKSTNPRKAELLWAPKA